MQTIIAWIVSLITSVSPLTQQSYYAAATETVAERQTRYESIAADAAAVVYDPTEVPLFGGTTGRARTLEVMLAVASYESGFRKDVDYGVGKLAKGDHGQSWCLMQIQMGPADASGRTDRRIIPSPNGYYEVTTDKSQGFGGEDLIADRKACFRVALHLLRGSFSACRNLPLKDRLRNYASGSCDRGAKESMYRMALASRWMQKAPPMLDSEVVSLLPGVSQRTASLDSTMFLSSQH